MKRRPPRIDIKAQMASLASRLSPPVKPSRKAKAKTTAKPKAAAPVAATATLHAIDGGKKPLRVTPDVLARASQRVRARKMDLTTARAPGVADLNPFKLPTFPPSVVPTEPTLAMDNQLVTWGQAQWALGAFQEGQAFLGYPYLAELAQRPEYRRITEKIATESTRKWIKMQVTTEGPPTRDGKKPKPADPDPTNDEKAAKLIAIEEEMKRLKVREAFREISEHDGFFGRAHLFLDFGDHDREPELATPVGDGRNAISLSKVSKERPLQRIKTVEPIWVYPSGYNANNPLSPEWYKPQSWYVMGRPIHVSRLLTFVSREVPDLLKPAYAFGGLSLSQMAKPYVDNWLRTRQSVSDTISNYSITILLTDMAASLGLSGEDLFSRVDLFNMTRDNRGAMVADKSTEDVKNISTPLSGLDHLQAQSQEQMASVCGIPIVILLGIQPMGLNASSEGEIRVFYDQIAAYQEAFFAEPLSRIIDFVQLSLFSAVDPEITFRFEPLWSLDEKGKAEVRKIEMETDATAIDKGVLDPVEVRERLASDPTSPYTSLDVEDVPEAPEETDPTGDPSEGSDPAEGQEPEAAQDAPVPFVGAHDWTEADHPRGQPGNAGQFGPGGGGGQQKKGQKQTAHAPQFGLVHGTFTAKGQPGQGPAPSNWGQRRSSIGESLDVSKLTKVGAQKGSNPGGVFKDESGKEFYVKEGKSKHHVRNEMTAAALYDLAGTPTLKYRPVDGGTHIATEIAKLDKDNASKLSKDERAEAARDFAVHAWLGNWDVVGLGGDNIGTVNGTPVPLDLGGALEYRAQGAPKGKAFGTKVTELDSLLDKNVNRDSAKFFDGMTPADMRESARYVTKISDSKIRATVEQMGGPPALADKLIARKNDIAERAKTFGAEGAPDKPTSTVVIPAGGALPVKELNGVGFDEWHPPDDWSTVGGQADIGEPEFELPQGKEAASGVVIREPDGRVWIVQPSGAYGGYEGTFPKGRAEEGLSMQANAIKEAYEESGLKVRITGFAGDHTGDATHTRYYHAVREGGDPSKHDKETEGVVLAPADKATGFLNRKRDRAVLAHDDFKETDHPRVQGGENAGQFAPKGGASGGSIGGITGTYKNYSPSTSATQHYSRSMEQVSKPAVKSTTYRWMIGMMIKQADHFGLGDQLNDKLQKKIAESWVKEYEGLVKKGEHALAEKVAAKVKKLGGSVGEPAKPSAPFSKVIPIEEPKAEPAPAPKPAFPPPTPSELEKAKKNVALQLQYVPNAPQTAAAQKLVDKFNEKYAGKELTQSYELVQKVNDFKAMQADMIGLMNEQQKQQAIAAAAEQAALKEKAEKAAQAEAEKLKAAKAELAEIVRELGLDSEADAVAVKGLMQLTGTSNPKDVLAQVKGKDNPLGKHGVTNFEYSLLRSYTGSAYGPINAALRSGVWSVEQHMYVNAVNAALKKMPPLPGVHTRRTDLTTEQQKLYASSNKVVEERAFTSTTKKSEPTFGGNTKFIVNGETGRDVQSISKHPGEAEVIYPARTFFRVDKVEGKPGGNMTVHLKEVWAS